MEILLGQLLGKSWKRQSLDKLLCKSLEKSLENFMSNPCSNLKRSSKGISGSFFGEITTMEKFLDDFPENPGNQRIPLPHCFTSSHFIIHRFFSSQIVSNCLSLCLKSSLFVFLRFTSLASQIATHRLSTFQIVYSFYTFQ